MSTTLFFGSFDRLHAGHHDALRQAAALGQELHVVVTRDEMIRYHKGQLPRQPEDVRRAAVAADPQVTRATLGSPTAGDYHLLRELTFDTLAVGYDQTPDDATIRQLLKDAGKQDVELVRLAPYQPEKYKSSLL